MKQFCKLFALLLALCLMLTACGAADSGDGAPDGAQATPEGETLLALGEELSLTAVSRYAGAFVEDGSDDIVSDVMAITVRNDGEKTVQYAQITLTLDGTDYAFEVSTLPAGASAQLLELGRQTMPDSTDGLTGQVTLCALFDAEPSLCGDMFRIETQDTAITVTNISGSDIAGPIYVYYKIAYDTLYMGGITYRVTVNGLKADESATCYAGHFAQAYSKLMFVNYAQ